MTRVLVTGATGFVGRHLMSGLGANPDFDTVGAARRAGEGVAWQLDLSDEGATRRMLDEAAPDAIVHAVGVRHGSADDLDKGNVGTARAILSAAASMNRRPRVILIGSAAEYGPQPGATPIREDALCAPASAYGISKLAATRLALEEGMETVVLRAFNLVGPGMVGLPGDAMRHISPAGPALDWGRDAVSLPMVRDFVRVTDLVEICRRALLASTPPRMLNVCTGHGRSFGSLLAEMETIAGVDFDMPDTRPGSDIVVGDPTLCESELGFRPSPEIGDMLAAAIEQARRTT